MVVCVGRNVEILISPDAFRVLDVPRDVAFGIELETKLHVGSRLLANRVKMEVEVELRARLDQSPRTLREDVAVLAQCVLVEESSSRAVGIIDRSVGLRHRLNRMVNHLEALAGFGL